MNGASILVRSLENEGVTTVFGYPGGAIMPVYDALVDSNLRHILMRHEQAAALAADGYARATGKVGVCMATSGPGATNLVTGIANAYMDSIPIVAITGQVPMTSMGTDAFQEVDIFGITMPIVKHSFIARNANQLPELIAEAFSIARSGRPGPVLIDIPKDVAVAPVTREHFAPQQEDCLPPPSAQAVARAAGLMRCSRKPVIYAGGGIRISDSVTEFRAFVETTGAPVVATLQGLGALNHDHPQFMGMLGMHGTKAANLAVQECDLLIAVGARFDDRVTGKLAEFAPNAQVIHMDADAAEIGKLRTAQAPLQGDIKQALAQLQIEISCAPWLQFNQKRRQEFAWQYDHKTEHVYAPRLLHQLSQGTPQNTFITCDVGQHQMWVAQHYGFNRPHQHLTSGGLGTMGYGLPAAIGVQCADPDALVVAVSGDGSIMMNIHELATIRRYKLPIKIVLFDNQALGMVRQWQELFFAERYSEVDLSDNPNFVDVAHAFGIDAFRVDRPQQEAAAVERLINSKGPVLAHVVIDPRENVWPLVPPGKANSQMMEASA
ncbi:MAG TPA: acetolactate synthase 2 catalytic subunit [Candidatus Obscuribacterales bacterium]